MFYRFFNVVFRKGWLWVFALAVWGCLRTEVVPDPESSKVKPSLRISPPDTALLVGSSFSITAQLYDAFGRKTAANPVWSSSAPAQVSITPQGMLTALNVGQVYITATVHDTVMARALVTTVASAGVVARVEVSTPVTSLNIGELAQLTAQAYTLSGSLVPGTTAQWFSDNPSAVMVSAAGEVAGVAPGTSLIAASINGITSVPVAIGVTPGERVARIMPGPVAGEAARGTARIVRLSSGALELRFDADFTTNNGPSLFVYLANCNLLSFSNLNDCPRVELGPLKSIAGAQSYPIPASVGINTYSHVLVHCKPFVVTFGTGRFE